MPSYEVAAALIAFKVAFPSLDILELIRRKPQLLRNQVDQRLPGPDARLDAVGLPSNGT